MLLQVVKQKIVLHISLKAASHNAAAKGNTWSKKEIEEYKNKKRHLIYVLNFDGLLRNLSGVVKRKP
jgi:hypothetical protein